MTGDRTTPPEPRPQWMKPMTLGVGAAVGLVAALYPLLPESYRPWNFAAFGALGLFVAARVGLLPALLLSLGAKLAADLLNYRQHGFDPAYLPSATVYACLALYALSGRAFLRGSESPWRIAGVAALSGAPFFLVTNFLAWQGKALPYPDTFAGLMESYWMALPFHRGTLLGDLAFGGLLFGAHAVLSRAYFPAERVAVAAGPVRGEVGD